MKEYKSNKELLEHLISKNVVVNNKQDALEKIEKYTYYSIVNSYKMTFKNSDGNYKDNVTFDEIFALYNFDKNIKYLFLKYSLEIEIQIKALMANHISRVYGIQDYLTEDNLFAGDTLFLEEIGRCDLPTGSFKEIEHSIKEKLFKLEDNIKVFTGHGDNTTIGHEKIHNAYFGINSIYS